MGKIPPITHYIEICCYNPSSLGDWKSWLHKLAFAFANSIIKGLLDSDLG